MASTNTLALKAVRPFLLATSTVSTVSRADFSTAQMREKKSTLAPDSVTKRSYTVIRYSALMGTQFSMFFLTWGTPFLDSSNIFSASSSAAVKYG